MADFDANFGHGDGHSLILHLADPGVHLLPGQEFFQALQGLQVVRHDDDHGCLFLAQGHVQRKEAVLRVLVEVVQTCVEERRGSWWE